MRTHHDQSITRRAGQTIDTVHEAPEPKPIMQGSYAMPAVLPQLSVLSLARLDRLGATDFADQPGLLARRAYRKAEKRALQTLAKSRKAEQKALHSKKRVKRAKREKTRLSLADRYGIGAGLAGRDRISLPWHTVGRSEIAVLDPLLHQGTELMMGPIIGVNTASGTPWRFDPWNAVRAGLVSSPAGVVVGLQGSGKSMMLKTMAARLILAGRNIIIEGDPKGEWAGLAHELGGTVVSAGGGNILNPLDIQAGSQSDTEARQMAALATMIAPLRKDAPSLRLEEQLIVQHILETFSTQGTTPTIRRLYAMLMNPDKLTIRELDPRMVGMHANNLALVLAQYVTGPWRGAFEDESSVKIDPASPLIVFDTGSINDIAERKAVYLAAMDAAIDRLLHQFPLDHTYRVVIAEEGHQLLSNPGLVSSWDQRLRLTGSLGCSCWMLIHEMQDLEKFASLGSAHLEQMKSIITLSSMKVLFHQSAASLASLQSLLPDLTGEEVRLLPQLPVGHALWRVGAAHARVHTLIGQGAYELINTDLGRRG